MGSPSLPYGSPYAAAGQGATRTKAAPYRKPRGAFCRRLLAFVDAKADNEIRSRENEAIPIKHAGVKIAAVPSPQKIRRSTGHPGQWPIALLGDELSATHGLPRGRSPD